MTTESETIIGSRASNISSNRVSVRKFFQALFQSPFVCCTRVDAINNKMNDGPPFRVYCFTNLTDTPRTIREVAPKLSPGMTSFVRLRENSNSRNIQTVPKTFQVIQCVKLEPINSDKRQTWMSQSE